MTIVNVFLAVLLISCNNGDKRTPELKEMGKSLGNRFKEYEAESKGSFSSSESKREFVRTLRYLREEYVVYFDSCEKVGAKREKDRILGDLDAIMQTVESKAISTTNCSICGRDFTGNGYHEVSDGVWEKQVEPYQASICSKNCGLNHTNNWNSILNK